jgi:hypothetical protein
MGSPNGGIIGVINPTSFGKCTVTSKTSSGPLTTQPGTRLVKLLSCCWRRWWWWTIRIRRWRRWSWWFKNLFHLSVCGATSISNYSRSRWSRWNGWKCNTYQLEQEEQEEQEQCISNNRFT